MDPKVKLVIMDRYYLHLYFAYFVYFICYLFHYFQYSNNLFILIIKCLNVKKNFLLLSQSFDILNL
jgi:hypothetical protein